ncbi:reverse transcriptase domain-containing protein [Solemya velum gill symbiont]|uniref:reverse transcriptase domain-containing protein n=1 Tax=Solemya velum gill symbiont TaxID=2340 RepID=UPI000997D4CC
MVYKSGTQSNCKTIHSGVPQGSILGPLLFLVYINDIVCDIKSEIKLFADDTSLSVIVDHPNSSAAQLQSDIDKISLWAHKWLVTFNPIKTECLLISRKTIKPVHPPLLMYGQNISEVVSHKHLGIILSNDCTWKLHIEYISKKAWSRINIMRRLKFILDRKSLETIYLSFITPSKIRRK